MTQTALFELAVREPKLAASVDRAVLTARARLGHAYGVAGRVAAAIGVLEENVAAAKALRGDDCPEVVVARNDVAWAMGKAGDLAGALARHERSLADLHRLLGRDSREAVRVELDLGRTLILAGRHNMALRHLEQASASISTSAPDHPDALACCATLATAYAAVGRTKDAVDLAERTAIECGDPAADLEAISCRITLGAIYVAVARSDEAVPVLAQAQAHLQQIFGAEHPETIRASFAFAGSLTQTGRLQPAVTELERRLDIATRVLGQHHPLTITGRDGLAAAYFMAGRTAQTVNVVEQTISDSPQSVAGGMQDTARRVLLARALVQSGRFSDAVDLLQEAIAGGARSGEGPDRATVGAQLLLADLYRKGGRKVDSEQIYRDILPDVGRMYGPDHQTTKGVRAKLRRTRRLGFSR